MESPGVVVDTSVFIEFLRAKDKKATELFTLAHHYAIYISSVTMYELYIGATDEQKREDVRLLTEEAIVLPFDERVSLKAAEIYHVLRRANKMIEFRDLFIAATCLENKLPIKTTNKSHFSRIKGLNVE